MDCELGSFLSYSAISVQKHNFVTSPLFKILTRRQNFPTRVYLLYGKLE